MKKVTYTLYPSSSVEQYFAHKCERLILYQGLDSDGKKELGFDTKSAGQGSEIAALAGYEWEKTVAQKLMEENRLVFKMGDEPGTFAGFDELQTVEELEKTVNEVQKDHVSRYLYQGSIMVTDAFIADHFQFNKALYDGTDQYLQIVVSKTHPDLIRVAWDDDTNTVIISVVDVKLARKMKIEHKMQVALYTRLLRYALAQKTSILAVVDENYGYLWNYGYEGERAFSLLDIEEILDEFFGDVFVKFVEKLYQGLLDGENEKLFDSLDLCVGASCEWCKNYPQCVKRLKEKKSISLLPYLTGYAQEYAKKIQMPDEIEAFFEQMQTPEMAEMLSGNRTWNYFLRDNETMRLHKEAAPYTAESVYAAGYHFKGVRSFELSNWQDVTLILTAHKDVATSRVYALGYYVNLRKKQESVVLNIAKGMTEEAYVQNARDFVRGLYRFLCNVSNKGDYSLQGFVMDSYERNNLEEVLYDLLERPDTSMEDMEKVIGVLFWLQGEKVLTDSPEQPQKVTTMPIISITSAFRKLVALPIPIAYTLRKIRSAYKVKVEPEWSLSKEDAMFFGQISDALPADVIHEIWQNDDTKWMQALELHLKKRLYTEARILFKLQIEGSRENVLTGKLGKFKLPEVSNISHPLLKKWVFETRYEEVLQYCDIRQARQQDLAEAMAEGDILRMQTCYFDSETKKVTFVVENDENIYRAQEWFSGLIAEDNEEALKEMYLFSDLERSGLFAQTFSEQLKVLNFLEFEKRDGRYYLSGTLCYGVLPPENGSFVYMSNRYADINSPKVTKQLSKMDAEENNSCLNPSELAHKIEGDYKVEQTSDVCAYGQMDGFDFTSSQKKAFVHLLKNSLTVLQGPPGTGKTDFIARAILAMCRYFKKEKGILLRVMVSANSHAAIENVLFAVADKMGNEKDILLYKMDRMDGEHLKVGVAKSIWGVQREAQETNKPMVVGATNWACDKMPDDTVFDLIIIDEASQVRVMDSMLALTKGDENTTRYLLVGDDDQLPPIIGGKYARDWDQPYIYGSVFRYYKDYGRLNNLDYCMSLDENFRMNDILARYSAEKIYGDAYQAFNSEIANRHLNYGVYDETVKEEISEQYRAWCEYVLDGMRYDRECYWPLVFCHIGGGNAKVQTELERKMVAELTYALKQVVASDKTDAEFWEKYFGIISPHHEHISKLKDVVTERTGMERDALYIGTVDKLQGQQREAVVVSYGVSDIEMAVAEGEFIYSRNRLNVSLTRAKAKTMVFLSDVLMRRPTEILSTENEELQQGIEYVCGFLPFMKRKESDSEISQKEFVFECGGQDVTVTVYRKRLV